MSRPLNCQLASTMMVLSFCVMTIVRGSAPQDVVCSGGFGSFKAVFATGVAVSVGAKPNSAFAARTCRAKFDWDKQEFLVEPEAWEVDVDAMGIDLGLGSPAVTFQIKRTDIDRVAKYEIYSLRRPPRELRTITGGDYYSAADTDLDGRIEIWTNDAGAVDGFENIPLTALDFVPTVVLRFEQKKLIEVNSEFQSDFDRQIATVRWRPGLLCPWISYTAWSRRKPRCWRSCGRIFTATVNRRHGMRLAICGPRQTSIEFAQPSWMHEHVASAVRSMVFPTDHHSLDSGRNMPWSTTGPQKPILAKETP
jgi:hypothetical protein